MSWQRPTISADVENIWHLNNRAAKAMREALIPESVISDMSERILNGNTRFTLPEAIEIVGEYVDFVEQQQQENQS